MGTSSPKACARKSPVTSLLYAVSEWLLIFMLFLDSIFSFFITKFARLWKLCTPCLLCSRLDHVFGSEKKGYLWKLICGKHKLEISSLVLCHAHNKLVNVHEMCNSCLCSFATIHKSNSETYRLLVGKLREDPHPASQRLCSCCKVPYVPRGFVQTLIQTRSSGWETEDLNVPLSSSVSRNPLPHVQCRELKITSDTVSDGNGCISKDDIGVRMEANFISVAGDLTTTKLVEPALTPEPLVLLTDTPPPVECDVLIGHGLDELTPKHVENNAVFSSSTDLLALDNVVPSSNTIATSVKALEGSCELFSPRISSSRTPHKMMRKISSFVVVVVVVVFRFLRVNAIQHILCSRNTRIGCDLSVLSMQPDETLCDFLHAFLVLGHHTK